MDLSKNFAKGALSAGYGSTATSIVLSTGDGARFPATAFNAVWWNSTDYPDPSDDPGVEIVRVTARTGDTLTIQRGQEGTAAVAHDTSGKLYKLLAGLTADTLNTLGGAWDFTGPQHYPGFKRSIHPLTNVRFDQSLALGGCLGFVPYWLNAPMTVESVSINHVDGTHASATLNFCFYSADPVTKFPTTKIGQSDASFSLATAGVKTVMYSPQPTIPRGLTWGAYVCSAPQTTVNPSLMASPSEAVKPIYQSLFGFLPGYGPYQYWASGGIFVPDWTVPPSSLPTSASSLSIYPAGTHAINLSWGVAFILLKEA